MMAGTNLVNIYKQPKVVFTWHFLKQSENPDAARLGPVARCSNNLFLFLKTYLHDSLPPTRFKSC